MPSKMTYNSTEDDEMDKIGPNNAAREIPNTTAKKSQEEDNEIDKLDKVGPNDDARKLSNEAAEKNTGIN